jgi:hypothetical protein
MYLETTASLRSFASTRFLSASTARCCTSCLRRLRRSLWNCVSDGCAATLLLIASTVVRRPHFQ